MGLPPRLALEDVARRAGRIALAHFRIAPAERKADRSLVTMADREVEGFLARELGRLVPEAAIVGEEGTMRDGRGDLTVLLDPIDGTAAFVAGLPTWCVSIGVLRAGEPVAGVVHAPASGELYAAMQGLADWNGTPLPRLGGAPAGDRFLVVPSKTHLRHRLTYPGKIRSLGSTAYHVALVARGAADAALLGRPQLWDVAAGAALLDAVGGRYEYLHGGRVELRGLGVRDALRGDVIAGAPGALAALRARVMPPAT